MKVITLIVRYPHACRIAFLASFSFFLNNQLAAQEGTEALPERWELLFKKQDISLYSRWVPVTANLKTRELRGILNVNASVERVLNLIQFTGVSSLWIDRSTSAHAFESRTTRRK